MAGINNESIYLGQLISKPVLFASCRLKEDDFTGIQERRIFRALKKCFADDITPDIMILYEIDPGISASYLAEITNINTTENWKFYHDAIKEASGKRVLRKLGEYLTTAKEAGLKELVNEIEMRLMGIVSDTTEAKAQTLKELIPEFVNVLEERYKAKGQYPGLTVSIDNINKSLLGFQKQKLYYIGARPSQGKSALILNFAVDLLKTDHVVGYFSAESSKTEVLTRLYAQEGHMNSNSLITGFYKSSEFAKIQQVSEDMYEKDFIIYDKSNMSMVDIRTQARAMMRKYNLDVIFLDYVQIITDYTHDTKRDQVAYISMALKSLARELDIPVVAAAQLKRDSENRKPVMGDFSDSSQLEKDADGVIMIYHTDEGKSWLCIEKARDGETGEFEVYFKREYTRFYEIGRREE